MNNKSRINSILHATSLDADITGLPAFLLSVLELNREPELDLPTNLRLGHLAEKIVSELLHASANYDVLYENVQIKDGQTTIGEIDFMVEDLVNKQVIHLELAYKFYLYDPGISSHQMHNWIGPNRKDSLHEKLEKLKTKQFPLLHHANTKEQISEEMIAGADQQLCFLVSLFTPYDFQESLQSSYQRAIRGYYIDLDGFYRLHQPGHQYYLPTKTEWGMDPACCDNWMDLASVEWEIKSTLEENRARLCWQKQGESHSEFFVVWW